MANTTTNMSVLPIIAIAARKSEETISVVPGSKLSHYPITDWDIRVIIVLWVLCFITAIFVVLRFYSRIKILHLYAVEDYLYNAAFVSLAWRLPFFPVLQPATTCLTYRGKKSTRTILFLFFLFFCSLFFFPSFFPTVPKFRPIIPWSDRA